MPQAEATLLHILIMQSLKLNIYVNKKQVKPSSYIHQNYQSDSFLRFTIHFKIHNSFHHKLIPAHEPEITNFTLTKILITLDWQDGVHTMSVFV